MSFKHVITTVVGITVVTVALAGCSSQSGKSAPITASAEPSQSQAAEQQTPSPTPSSKPAASGEVDVTSDKITDDQMGHTVQADKVVRNFPWTSAQSGLADRDDNEQVLVHVAVTAGEKYYSTVDCLAIRVQAHGSTESYTSQGTTSVVEDAMKAAGYPALTKVDQGQSGEGWCAYSVADPSDVLDLEYQRNAAASNGGTQITAKDFYAPMTPVAS
ncbi:MULTISPECIES: hypothetical protein [unclassified Curtobacterium]|uniref:hypothetical protein n=1 Tax=unclassified Curtobacterium TaxID=257496 RepID=UPI000DA85B07|nr:MULTISPECIES: hypothetical protein [unclassified Curtobacterium]PZE37145.1 hypothetical protein DEJ31_08490 [Curtobacterium sp. MCPF17_031]PZF15519.1 hypothetical protein DEJ25_01980 [Curtobacterium sp. MCPF17_011]